MVVVSVIAFAVFLELVKTFLDGGEACLGVFLAGPGVGGHLADNVEFLPSDEIERGQHLVDPATDHGLHFLAQAMKGGKGATRDPGEVVEKAWPFWHGRYLPFRAAGRALFCCDRSRDPIAKLHLLAAACNATYAAKIRQA